MRSWSVNKSSVTNTNRPRNSYLYAIDISPRQIIRLPIIKCVNKVLNIIGWQKLLAFLFSGLILIFYIDFMELNFLNWLLFRISNIFLKAKINYILPINLIKGYLLHSNMSIFMVNLELLPLLFYFVNLQLSYFCPV